MFHNIPDDLKNLYQWVTWRGEIRNDKPTKVPYNPATGKMAKTDDPTTWVSFDYACQAVDAGIGYDGIGFVFTKDDDFAGIDLDATDDPNDYAAQRKIFEAMDSYSELSPSGRGCHIIVRGYVPEGRKRRHVELYSYGRFFTMTGNVIFPGPIREKQSLVSQLYKELSAGKTDLPKVGETTETLNDAQVYEIAVNAANGDKFQNLWRGDWKLHYSSQSEADYALINMLGYYSRHVEQIERMFLLSALGQRDKAKRRNYVRHMAIKSFDNVPEPIDFDAMKAEIAKHLAASSTDAQDRDTGGVASTVSAQGDGEAALSDKPPSPYNTPAPSTYDGINLDLFRRELPPGIIGDMARHIYRTSPRPVEDIALVSALGLFAGIVGRQYNVSATGLAQYFMLFAASARGKEALKQGVDRIVNAVATKAGVIRDYIGPGEIRSGQAILKYLSDKPQPVFVSIIGEFGLKMRQLSSEHANPAQAEIKSVLLDLYNKSGATNTIQPSIYADKKNNTDVVYSPAVSLVGETIPEEFFDGLDTSVISGGLLPRFVSIHYKGNRPPPNYDHDKIAIPGDLVDTITEIVTYVNIAANNNAVVNVEMRDEEAFKFHRWLDRYCDDKINSFNSNRVLDALWSRVVIKVLKLSALLAVSEDYKFPTISRQHMEWALSLVLTDVLEIERKVSVGEITSSGAKDSEQERAIMAAVNEYLTSNFETVRKYHTKPHLHAAHVIPHSYLVSRLRSQSVFRDKHSGRAGDGIKRAISAMIDNGTMRRVPDAEIVSKFGYHGVCYVVSDLDAVR